jgi:hypothetical protein
MFGRHRIAFGDDTTGGARVSDPGGTWEIEHARKPIYMPPIF